jgi:hypothetical protein
LYKKYFICKYNSFDENSIIRSATSKNSRSKTEGRHCPFSALISFHTTEQSLTGLRQKKQQDFQRIREESLQDSRGT